MPPGSTLNYTIAGDSMELSPVGIWTAAHSQAHEERLTAVAPQVSAARKLAINMAGVHELDTLGAWLLERMVRGCVDRKSEVRFSDLPERYRGLFDQVSSGQSPDHRTNSSQECVIEEARVDWSINYCALCGLTANGSKCRRTRW